MGTCCSSAREAAADISESQLTLHAAKWTASDQPQQQHLTATGSPTSEADACASFRPSRLRLHHKCSTNQGPPQIATNLAAAEHQHPCSPKSPGGDTSPHSSSPITSNTSPRSSAGKRLSLMRQQSSPLSRSGSRLQQPMSTVAERYDTNSHAQLQAQLLTDTSLTAHLEIKSAGLKHIGFGPLKKENQDEFSLQAEGFGGHRLGSCWSVFDGHGTHGGKAAAFCKQTLPALLDTQLTQCYAQEAKAQEPAHSLELQARIRDIIINVFLETERQLPQAGVNVSSSGTTASVVYRHGHQVWCAAAGDSRVIAVTCNGSSRSAQPLTIDHRPARMSEKTRVEAAGARVAPKTLASGKTVGEPRLWMPHIPTPGLLLSRSIGDEMASSIGCTARPEVTFMKLRPGVDQYLVMASDGVWDVLDNDRVCQIVSSAGGPEAACEAVLQAALEEWEERLAADNICIVVVQYLWGGNSAAQLMQLGFAANSQSDE